MREKVFITSTTMTLEWISQRVALTSFRRIYQLRRDDKLAIPHAGRARGEAYNNRPPGLAESASESDRTFDRKCFATFSNLRSHYTLQWKRCGFENQQTTNKSMATHYSNNDSRDHIANNDLALARRTDSHPSRNMHSSIDGCVCDVHCA